MIVCVCRRISDREIVHHAHCGMGFDELQFELGLASQCGRCEDCARRLLAQCAAAPQTMQLASPVTESSAWNSHSWQPLRAA